ncbi:hypothetical protein ACTPOK_19220 [Streptomyces inhibens]|uniref:hypothetical protein n=1 Tax=Streptomyces inhibens TaxID=2293571 RepID=UPI00402AD8E0
MNAGQQHLLDTYRAARRGEAAPPDPHTQIARTTREIHRWHRFHAIVTAPGDRLPARIRRALRTTVASLLRTRPRRPLPGTTPAPAPRPRSGAMP